MDLTQNTVLSNDAGAPASWYALYTRHQHEKTVARILSNNGFETFLPLYSVSHRWQDRTKKLSLPLFPCYVFLRGGFSRRAEVVATPGVHMVVATAGRWAAIPQEEIDAVRQVIETSTRVEPHPFLKCGEWVRVKAGSLVGIEGILVRKKNLFRLVLSVEILGSSAAVEVESSNVERVRAPNAGAVPYLLPTSAAARV